ncbi:MAG: RraA family protein [Chloroflexi bacterium]|nr:RraA family protein [Chloroflexota bacterium]
MGDQATVPGFEEASEILKRYRYLRVTDVTDALDAVGRQDICMMDPAIRPLWPGMKFWGIALTLRAIPANRHMPRLSKEEAVRSHAIWFSETPHSHHMDLIRPGHVIVTATCGARETGIWGSNNSLAAVARGAVGIVTDGVARDTGELTLQRTPVASRGRGRTIIPGRIEFDGEQIPVGCGGVQVRPNDIIGCDDDGVVVVPIEVAAEVADIAAAILIDDMKGRRRLYERLKMPLDDTVNVEMVEAYYRQF